MYVYTHLGFPAAFFLKNMLYFFINNSLSQDFTRLDPKSTLGIRVMSSLGNRSSSHTGYKMRCLQYGLHLLLRKGQIFTLLDSSSFISFFLVFIFYNYRHKSCVRHYQIQSSAKSFIKKKRKKKKEVVQSPRQLES